MNLLQCHVNTPPWTLPLGTGPSLQHDWKTHALDTEITPPVLAAVHAAQVDNEGVETDILRNASRVGFIVDLHNIHHLACLQPGAILRACLMDFASLAVALGNSRWRSRHNVPASF